MVQNPHRCRCGERRRDWTAWLRCAWVGGDRQLVTRAVSRRGQHSPPRTAPCRCRYKIRPARAARGHFRYKTLLARPKWPNLALFLHAGRGLYRSRHQEAQQGEFCTEREAEIERANTTAHQAPPAWSGRHPRSRRTRPRCGLRPVGRASAGSQGHRQTNFACNSIGPNFNKPRKRCNSNDANSMFE